MNCPNLPRGLLAREYDEFGTLRVDLTVPHLALGGVGGGSPGGIAKKSYVNFSTNTWDGLSESHVAGEVARPVVRLILDASGFQDRHIVGKEAESRRRVTRSQSGVESLDYRDNLGFGVYLPGQITG